MRPGNGVYEYCRGDATNNCHAAYWAARRTGRRSVAALRFGVEIEFVGDQYAVETACNAVGLSCRRRAYTHETTSYWKVVGDGSVVDGGELVSPPLHGDPGYRQVEAACLALADAGVSVDVRCGLHVHLEVRGYRTMQIRNIYETWYNNQPLINALVPPSRRNGRWSLDVTVNDLELVRRLTHHGTTRSDTARGLSQLARYSVLNGTAYGRYGTLEVRNHGGTLRADKIVTWVKFCRALFTWAVTTGDPGPAQPDLESLLTELHAHGGITDADRQFLLLRARRIQEAADARPDHREQVPSPAAVPEVPEVRIRDFAPSVNNVMDEWVELIQTQRIPPGR